MILEVLNTGSELLLGKVINTNLRYLAEALFPLGLRISRQASVPDGEPIRDGREPAPVSGVARSISTHDAINAAATSASGTTRSRTRPSSSRAITYSPSTARTIHTSSRPSHADSAASRSSIERASSTGARIR